VVPGRIRHDGEGRITGLADQGKVAFVLLGVAEPARPDQHDRSIGCSDGLLQRVQGKPGARLRRSKNGLRPFPRNNESISDAWRASACE
jgi:hypothetical protein